MNDSRVTELQDATIEKAEFDQAPPDISRYFAAAAYRDVQFRHKVLDFLRHSWYQARPPEFGIDEEFVAAHCRRAEQRERLRDLLMVAIVLVTCYNPILALFSNSDDAVEILSYFSTNIFWGFALASVVLFSERLLTQHFTTTKIFGRSSFAKTELGPARSHAVKQNLVVYGGYSPFVGSGYDVGGWSFSVNLERTKDEFGSTAEMLPFEAEDLLRDVRKRLDRLQINGLQHYEVLFVDGRLLRDNDEFSREGRPVRQVADAVVARFADIPDAGARSYLCVQVADWSGEIVLSAYIRCKKADTNLFLEASYFLLAPPKRSFFAIDEVDPQLRISAVIRLFTGSVLKSTFVLLLALLRLWQWVLSPLTHWLERRRIKSSMNRNPRFNLGATTSIREIGMENYFRVYFQRLDKEQRLKTIEQCTIDAIVNFLGKHNIDTSDIKDRKTAILNNGIIMAGGDLRAESLAVGSGAQAMISRVGAAAGLGKARTPHSDKRKAA